MRKRFFAYLLAAVMVMTSADFTVLASGMPAGEEETVTVPDSMETEEEENLEEKSESDIETVEMSTVEESEAAESSEEVVGERENDSSETESSEEAVEGSETDVAVDYEGETETLTGQCGDNLTWTLENGTLTISGTGEMYRYSYDYNNELGTYITSAPWGQYASMLKELVIEEGVTTVGICAFYGCSGFTGSLTIPSGVTFIGSYAFEGCSGLTGSLTIPSGVTYIDDFAFSGCRGLTGSLTIPSGVTTIGSFAFSGCSGLTGSLTIPSGVTTIESYAFQRCRGFTGSLTISSGVTTIGEYAFSDCSGLTGSLTIPSGVTEIGRYAFSGCRGFTGSLTIPSGVTEIGGYAFYGCSGLTGSLTIPSGVTTIGKATFHGCSGLTGSLTIPSGVTTIGSIAFYGCRGFTGSLTIPSSVTEIGESAFSGCSGFTGSLTIPTSVTEIGGSVFYGCSGFTGSLTISTGVTEIGNYAFYGCSGFTGSLIIPTGVTEIGNYAFYGCSGLTGSLTIPSSVTEIGQGAFSGCSGLNGKLYIPETVISIGTSAFEAIPNTVIYGMSGSYAETYANNEDIPFIPYNVNGPENETVELTDCANIYIVDSELGTPIINAIVNGTAVDANGYIALQIAEGGEEKYICVTADGYDAYMSCISLKQNGTYYISLKPTDGAFEIVYANATIGNTITSLLSNKIYLENTSENIEDSTSKSTLEIQVKARGDVKSYAIYQGETMVASSTDGAFSLPIIQQNGQNALTNLQAQKSVTVRATDADGKTTSTRLGIYISPEGTMPVEEEDKSGSLSLGSGVSVTLPDTIPFLGGGTVNFGLKNSLPFDLTIERNGQVKIAINKDVSESIDAFKEEYDQLADRAKNLSNAAAAFGGTPESFGGGFFSASVYAKGYGEGYIDMSKPGTFEIKVGVIVVGKTSAGYTQYFFAGSVPIYITVEAGAEVKGSATLSLKCENGELKTEGGVGTLSGKIYLTAKAGVGVENLVKVGVSGTGACNYYWKPLNDYTKVWLTAQMRLEAKCFMWEKDLWTSPEATYTIYESSANNNVAAVQSVNDTMTAQLYDSGSYTIMDRSYQSKPEETEVVLDGASNENTGVIQSGVYPGADPKLVNANGTFYLFWLQDIATRSAENRSAVVYASSADGMNWSTPKQLIDESENETLDNGIDVFVDGTNIYICWQDAAESYPSGTSLNEAVQKLHVAYAVIDGTTGNVTSKKIVTEQAGCYLQPTIYAKDGQVQIAWVENSMTGESIWSTENKETLMKYDSESGETVTLSIGNNKEKLVSMDGAVGTAQKGVIYTLDIDGDLLTIDDRKVYYDTRFGAEGSQMVLTETAGTYASPVAEGGNYYWYADGNISYAVIGSNAVQQMYTEKRADVGSDFQVLSEGDKTEIIWNAIEYETEKVALYGITSLGSGQWSNPYILKQTDSEMTGEVSGSLKNGVPYLSYLDVKNKEDGSKSYSLCVTEECSTIDLTLNYAVYEYEQMQQGQVLPITVELTNKGTVKVESVEVKWDGNTIGTQTVDLNVGETETVVLNQYTVPADLNEFAQHTLSVEAVSESNTEDNSYTVGIGYTDMKVLCAQRLHDENTWLDISVLNDSRIASDAVLNIRADREDGEILYTEELGNIEGGKGISLTVNLQNYESTCCTYFVEVVSSVEDVIEGNNVEFVYTGYGTEVEGGDLVRETVMYQVTFDSNGGSAIESEQVEEGRSVTEPQAPEREGYQFMGWYLNGELYDFYTPVSENITLKAEWQEYEVLAAPSATIESGSTVEKGTKVSLTCAASGAQIYYTLDGAEPTVESTCFTEPIEILEDITIKAFAVREGFKNSEVVTFTYTVKEDPVLEAPSASVASGSIVKKGTKVSLTCTTPDAKIYYTLDETEPTVESTCFTEPIEILEDITIKAFAVREGFKNSEVVTFTYTVKEDPVLEAPSASVASGSIVKKGTKVSLTCTTPDAKIYYTLDGTEPTVESTCFTEPIEISEDTIIKAFAAKEGFQNSEIATFTYQVSDTGNESDDENNDNKNEEDESKGNEDTEDSVNEGVLPEDIPVNGIPDGLWIAGVSETGYTYTGKAIKPVVRVYDGERRLKAGQDYTISYKNNTKANDAANTKTAPTIIVKGKGNYAGKETATFKILSADLADNTIFTEDITVAYNKKVQKKVPMITYNGKKLTNKKDFTVSYPALEQGVQDAYKAPGEYDIVLIAKENGNFTGTRTVKLTITESTLISKASVKKIPNQTYTGNAIEPKLTVSLKKTQLVEGTDYTVSCENNTEIGTATVKLTGIGNYAGTKKLTFKITGESLKSAVVTGIEDKVYNGKEQKQNLTVALNNKTLVEGTDYKVVYANNKKAGKATVTIKGINAYTGTVKKTFKITAYNLAEDNEKKLSGLEKEIQTKYLKGGNKPEISLTFDGTELIAGQDYTISYKNNKTITTKEIQNLPTIMIKGKGNYSGTLTKTFTIEGKALDDAQSPVTITVADVGFVDKAGKYISKPVLTDADGKKLVAGKDYEKEVTYTLEDGTALDSKSKVNAEMNVKVTVKGKGAYSGTLEAVYRITKSDFKKAKINISAQIYTGEAITLDESDITVKVGNTKLTYGTDYEIVNDSYSNNIKKGTAKVTVIGKGNYGGTKAVKFKIVPKQFAWFWRLFG